MDNLTKHDVEAQNELIISSILTITAKITEDVRDENAKVFYQTTKRILEVEEDLRQTKQNFTDRLDRIDDYLGSINEFDKLYIKVRKNAYKIFSIIVIICLILLSYF